MGFERLLTKRIKFPCMDIRLKLSVPRLRIERGEPSSQLGEFLLR